MTLLRQRMIDAMVLRGFAARTQETYLFAVGQLARHHHRSPELLSDEQIQAYLLYLLQERKRSANPSFLGAMKLRTSCFDIQRARRGEHGSTADGALPGTGGGVSGLGADGQGMG